MSVCSGRTDAGCRQADCELSRLERRAVRGESERSSVSEESTEQADSPLRLSRSLSLTHTRANKQHRETGHGCSLKATAAQQTQPWPTLRSKGSNGSSKKFSKAKRCGNITVYFSASSQLLKKKCFSSVNCKLPGAVIMTNRFTLVRFGSCVAAGQAQNRRTLASFSFKSAPPLLCQVGVFRKHRGFASVN